MKLVTAAGDVRGKTVLLRLNLNVPIIRGEIRDDFRIKSGLRTLSYLREQGAKVLIISHIENAETTSLEKVAEYLKRFAPVDFVNTFVSAKERLSNASSGDCVLLENVRRWPGEKDNDERFSAELAKLGELYVNEDFAVSHRVHASVVSVPRLLPRFCGFAFDEEVRHLSKAFAPQRPFLFILGGAKFETKMPLIKKFLGLADFVYVAGALANDFFRERGYEIGRSIVATEHFHLKELNASPKLYLPEDVVVEQRGVVSVKKPDQLERGEKIFDAGPQSLRTLGILIKKSKFVLWNGPLGDYEHGFEKGSELLASHIAKSSAESVIGGGDTIAVTSRLGLFEKFSFVSTGGGAMLDFLANETLPGIEALNS